MIRTDDAWRIDKDDSGAAYLRSSKSLNGILASACRRAGASWPIGPCVCSLCGRKYDFNMTRVGERPFDLATLMVAMPALICCGREVLLSKSGEILPTAQIVTHRGHYYPAPLYEPVEWQMDTRNDSVFTRDDLYTLIGFEAMWCFEQQRARRRRERGAQC